MIIAVIDTFNPEPSSFIELVKRLILQVDKLCIVDNNPHENDSVWEIIIASDLDLERISLIRLGDNLGIATALNIGIDIAISDKADWILLSDQDSLPSPNMVAGLLNAFNTLSKENNIGAIGPTFTDLHTKLTYPFQFLKPGNILYTQKPTTSAEPFVETLTLITSGCLIPTHVLENVGGMLDNFFIDQVDIEWCHRARAKGYKIFGTSLATMYQRMGDDRLRVWYFGWRYESAYSPLRMYYRIRNFVALWKKDYIEWGWKLRSSWYWLGFIYTQVIFGQQRLACLRMAIKGVWHGMTGRMGRYKD